MANAKEVSPQHALPFEEDVHTSFSNPALDEVVRSTPGSEAVVSDAVKTDGAASGNDGPDTASLQQAVTVGSPSPEHGVDGRAHAEQDQPHTTETVAAAAHERLGLSKWQHRYMVVVFALMAALLNADQNLLQPHLTQVAEDFGISEDDKDTMLGGYIPAAFFCVGAPSALLLGWCADKYNRQYMLFAVVIIGQGPTLATYWVDKYWQLFLLRVITGVAVGGVFPLLYSMLGDMYPASQRVGVAAFVSIATGAGVAAGQGLSGFAGNGNWRIPFLIIAAPSIALAFVMLMTTHEPARGVQPMFNPFALLVCIAA